MTDQPEDRESAALANAILDEFETFSLFGLLRRAGPSGELLRSAAARFLDFADDWMMLRAPSVWRQVAGFDLPVISVARELPLSPAEREARLERDRRVQRVWDELVTTEVRIAGGEWITGAPSRPVIFDMGRSFVFGREGIWRLPEPVAPSSVFSDLMWDFATSFTAPVNSGAGVQPLTLETMRLARERLVERCECDDCQHRRLVAEEERDPKLARFNKRLRDQGIGVSIRDRCPCPLCTGARARLRTDGSMAEVDSTDRMHSDGHVAARTDLRQRQENTVDAVLGNIDELLAEYREAQEDETP